MEVVKQRKKRLLAWILTIGLCVGMWHGSAYATEENNDVSVSGNDASVSPNMISQEENAIMQMSMEDSGTVVDGNDTIVMEEVPATDTVAYNVILYACDENGNDVIDYLRGDVSGGIQADGKLISWGFGDSGTEMQFSSQSNAITGVAYENNVAVNDTESLTLVHNILGWYNKSDVTEGDGLDSSKMVYGDTLDLDQVVKNEYSEDGTTVIGKTCEIYAVLGKSAIVRQPWDDQVTSYSQEALSGDGASFSVTLPDQEDNMDEGIFIGWRNVEDEGDIQEAYNGTYTKAFSEFMNFESNIEFMPVYGWDISEEGSYTLYPGNIYGLLNDMEIADDYTYKSGISFVIEGSEQSEGDVEGIPITFQIANMER